ncbi:hypothetical protein Bbelb_241760 [Branchiostoma belcheri]|nr:hypothetical protein Bbelb_241760 [Branchiostoma belcheri]
MYEQAEPVRTPQAGSGREQNNRPRAPYPDPPGRRGNTIGHNGCNVEMCEQAEPVRTPQAGSGREQNVGPRAAYQDRTARQSNTSGGGKHASHAYQEKQDTSSNVYEEAEAVKLENISGDVPYGTDTSTDTDKAEQDGARGRRVCYMAAAMAIIVTLGIVVGVLLMFVIHGTSNNEKDIPVTITITITASVMDRGYKTNQSDAMEQRFNEKTNLTEVSGKKGPDIDQNNDMAVLFFASSEENYVSRLFHRQTHTIRVVSSPSPQYGVLGLVMGGLGGNVTVQRKVEPRMTLTRVREEGSEERQHDREGKDDDEVGEPAGLI